MDGVVSHACNSMTSMYYLLIQKFRNALSNKTPISSNNGQPVLKPNPSQPKPTEPVNKPINNDQAPATSTLNDKNNENNETNQQNTELIQVQTQIKSHQPESQSIRPKSRGGISSNSRNNVPDPRIAASQQQQQKMMQLQQQQYSNSQNAQKTNPQNNPQTTEQLPINTPGNVSQQRVVPTPKLVSPYAQTQQGIPPASNIGVTLDKYLENGIGRLGIVGSNNPTQNSKPTSRGGSRIRTGGGNKKAAVTPLVVGPPQSQQAQLLQQNGIVVPKLNLFPQTNAVNKDILTSQTSRNAERAKSASGSHSARASVPNRGNNNEKSNSKNSNLISNIDDHAVISVPVDILGPMPDGDTERPTTRRSRLRSRGDSDSSNQDEDGSGLIPSAPTDIISQGKIIIVINICNIYIYIY
jgi:hypothetical protein